MKLGFVGLGAMGRYMAENLVKASYTVTVHDINRESGRELEKSGATWADSIESLASSSEMVFTSLPGPAEVEAVTLGSQGLIETLRPGSTYVDLSTNSPSLIRRIADVAAQRGVYVIDAPVSGGAAGAKAGTLALYVGGDADAIKNALPALQAIGSNILQVGPAGAGNIVKLVNNMVALVNFAGVSEGLAIAMKGGVDPDIMVQALSGGTANSWVLQQGVTRMLRGENINFGAALAAKDARLAINLARENHLPVLLSRMAEALMTQYERAGGSQYDFLDLGRRILEESGISSVAAAH